LALAAAAVGAATAYAGTQLVDGSKPTRADATVPANASCRHDELSDSSSDNRDAALANDGCRGNEARGGDPTGSDGPERGDPTGSDRTAPADETGPDEARSPDDSGSGP
jgi:hypothetical protein